MAGNHTNCNSWDYETHPDQTKLVHRCDKIIRILAQRPQVFDRLGYSTERGHRYMFSGYAPPLCKYFAGNYRGSEFPCLKEYSVTVPGHPVGYPPIMVRYSMNEYEKELRESVVKLATAFATQKLTQQLLGQFAGVIAYHLTKFFTIHPYANGNGHAGRLLVSVILARFQLPLANWPLETSPPYGNLIAQFRAGNKTPLEQFVLNRICA